MKRVEIDGVFLELAPPESTLPEWIGQDETLRQLLACWLEAVPGDPPLTPRLVGAPGLGKTTLAMAAAKSRGQRCWVQQCTADTRPEDLVVTPVLVDQGRIAYRASPLLTAVIEGGCCVLDEGNRMSEKSWASLASLLDHRRTIDSVIAGIRVAAAPSFRACVTMNDDGSTFELPEYILSRLQPAIELGYPAAEEEERILAFHVPHAAEELRARCVRFLQEAHGLDLPFSIRDGIHSLRLALKRGVQEGRPADEFLDEALRQVCGREAMDLKAMSLRRPPQSPTDRPGDFFFGSEDEDLDPDWDGRR